MSAQSKLAEALQVRDMKTRALMLAMVRTAALAQGRTGAPLVITMMWCLLQGALARGKVGAHLVLLMIIMWAIREAASLLECN